MPAPVAVAVVSWNTRELLGACLWSLRGDSDAGLVDVWVVDNGSTDGSAELVRREFGWVSLVESAENLGFGAAVNEIARRTESAWLAPSNADVAVSPGAIETLLHCAADDPGAGCVAPRLVTPAGTTQHSVHAFPPAPFIVRTFELQRLSPRLGDSLCLEGAWDERRPRRVGWADGAFLLVRRDAFDAVGGFDARQWMYAEDMDLSWRLARAGWATRYEPRATVRHAVSAAARDAFGSDRFPQQVAAMYRWMARRRGVAVARSCALTVVGGEAVKYLALRPLIGRLSPARRLVAGRARRRVRLHRIGLARRELLLGEDPGRR